MSLLLSIIATNSSRVVEKKPVERAPYFSAMKTFIQPEIKLISVRFNSDFAVDFTDMNCSEFSDFRTVN